MKADTATFDLIQLAGIGNGKLLRVLPFPARLHDPIDICFGGKLARLDASLDSDRFLLGKADGAFQGLAFGDALYVREDLEAG